MKRITADNIPIERETWWFQQSVGVKVFLFAAIVACVPLFHASYGLAMGDGEVVTHCKGAPEAPGSYGL